MPFVTSSSVEIWLLFLRKKKWIVDSHRMVFTVTRWLGPLFFYRGYPNPCKQLGVYSLRAGDEQRSVIICTFKKGSNTIWVGFPTIDFPLERISLESHTRQCCSSPSLFRITFHIEYRRQYKCDCLCNAYWSTFKLASMHDLSFLNVMKADIEAD